MVTATWRSPATPSTRLTQTHRSKDHGQPELEGASRSAEPAKQRRKAGRKRRKAGRKPKGPRAGSPHKARPELRARHPVHVVLRVVSAVGYKRGGPAISVREIPSAPRQSPSGDEPARQLAVA